jgi:hypothetical protein
MPPRDERTTAEAQHNQSEGGTKFMGNDKAQEEAKMAEQDRDMRRFEGWWCPRRKDLTEEWKEETLKECYPEWYQQEVGTWDTRLEKTARICPGCRTSRKVVVVNEGVYDSVMRIKCCESQFDDSEEFPPRSGWSWDFRCEDCGWTWRVHRQLGLWVG